MNDEKPLTGVRKRAQIANANKQMFVWVAVSAVVIVICVVLAINFIQRIVYQAKVNGKLDETAKILATNIDTIDDLKTEVDKLSTDKNLNLPNLRADDSTAFQVVLDALPTSDDRVSLGASLQQKILVSSGVSIEQISVTNSGSSSTTSGGTAGETEKSSTIRPTAETITFSFVIKGHYDAIQTALLDIERTIRPITIDVLNLQGSDADLQATINATTYFVPKVYWQTSEETVPVGDKLEEDTTGTDDGTGGTQ